MKRLIAIVLFMAASIAPAADLTVVVPSSAVPKAQEMCEVLRLELHVRAAEWSNDLCASIFTRIGLRVYVQRQERQGAQQLIDAAVQAEIEQFDADWAEPFTRAYCGDTITDVEFGEQCDDGGIEPGDGCDQRCQIEP